MDPFPLCYLLPRKRSGNLNIFFPANIIKDKIPILPMFTHFYKGKHQNLDNSPKSKQPQSMICVYSVNFMENGSLNITKFTCKMSFFPRGSQDWLYFGDFTFGI